jgi:AcrR family transcriptional regulator
MGRQFPSPPAFHNSTMALDDAAPQLPVFFEDLRRLPPGRHSVPSEEVARQQRLRLMAGMLDAVGEQGYVATSVADVLSRAGVSRRTFYEHFSDKEDCFLQAFDHVATIGREAVGDAFRKEDGWRRAVRTGLSTFLHTAAANPRFARACLVEILAVGPEGVRRRDGAVPAILRAGPRAGAGGRPDPRDRRRDTRRRDPRDRQRAGDARRGGPPAGAARRAGVLEPRPVRRPDRGRGGSIRPHRALRRCRPRRRPHGRRALAERARQRHSHWTTDDYRSTVYGSHRRPETLAFPRAIIEHPAPWSS